MFSAYAELEERMRGRLGGRECLYVPSCRFGLYLALRHWCRPGGKVLMSPVNDDVIFFVVLAAGLRPVQAPLDPRDGSIDTAAVPESVWRDLSAVLTTNLYGNPDPAPDLRGHCDRLGIPLIEDAAHAIGSTVGGRPVGTYGEASVFSLSKHTGAKTGGFLALADPALREELAAAREALLHPTRPTADLAHLVRPYAEATLRGLRLVGAARAAVRRLGLEEREEIRMPLRAEELTRALTAAPALEPFHSWVRVDMHDYRLRPGAGRLRRTTRRFARLDDVLDAHRAGTALLLAGEYGAAEAFPGDVPEKSPAGAPPQPLYRVPLLVDDRDAAVAALARRRITTGYLYDPPLDSYAGEAFTDPSPAPEPAAWFARHALPVDPRRAAEALTVLRDAGIRPARRSMVPGGSR
ncbi:DegT/DnrJ/EryC1/StrS family aminotransferase [Streptomyces sp. TX20-6-3]|uniref:DegT/DnrJ/EryC1/StrS family aminotransferase n=1 Tax=Streptomyces sp. TX20-6-3 TaxID=3028705 RepID=UPI0029A5FD39|nr:DegT/DnrJ/EryC1/StrS family aminotransferase [Streptomyces sp. TX20-6-3]MDX2563717.1 DegT/DnrJ/EryC1/StrS family aminotransferase [Streptomyces sp. TX20-6-3]